MTNKQLHEAAEEYADSLERRLCSHWQGLYKGFKDGYNYGKERKQDRNSGWDSR